MLWETGKTAFITLPFDGSPNYYDYLSWEAWLDNDDDERLFNTIEQTKTILEMKPFYGKEATIEIYKKIATRPDEQNFKGANGQVYITSTYGLVASSATTSANLILDLLPNSKLESDWDFFQYYILQYIQFYNITNGNIAKLDSANGFKFQDNTI
jgi:hypothetical protein